MSRLLAWLPLALNRLAWFIAIFLLGYSVSSGRVWPSSVITDGLTAAHDLTINVQTYLGLFPTRYIFNEPHGAAGVTVYDESKVQAGVTFMTGFFDGKQVMKLIDKDGSELHRWEVSFEETFPSADHIVPAADRPLNKWLSQVHGAYPFGDGSVVFNFDDQGLARIDACGNVMWTVPRMTHHSISVGDDGTIWVPSRVYHEREDPRLPLLHAPFFEDQLLQVSADGDILREISLPELLFKNDLYGIVLPTGVQEVGSLESDITHTNDAEVLTSDLAGAFPMFEDGDILVSMRHLNLVFVFDPRTDKVLWFQVGPWWRQHDPDFLKDGTISVFNNRSDDTEFGSLLGGSEITRIDPKSRKTWTFYSQPNGDEKRRFFSNFMGKQQTLDNGNVLITEPDGGRVFEVTPTGDIVWQYINRFDKSRVALITEAVRLPDDYFNFDPNQCGSKEPLLGIRSAAGRGAPQIAWRSRTT